MRMRYVMLDISYPLLRFVLLCISFSFKVFPFLIFMLLIIFISLKNETFIATFSSKFTNIGFAISCCTLRTTN